MNGDCGNAQPLCARVFSGVNSIETLQGTVLYNIFPNVCWRRRFILFGVQLQAKLDTQKLHVYSLPI